MRLQSLLILILICTCVLMLASSPASAGVTTRISVASDGTEGYGDSGYPSSSADGRYVAFASYADNLVPGDTNGYRDVFVGDPQTGEITRVSVASNGTQGNDWSWWPSISADGRYVAFHSRGSNLVPGDTNGYGDVFVRDRQTSETTIVSMASDGTQGNWESDWPSISADGRYVAFRSGASNLVAGDTNGYRDVFVRDRHTGETTRVSLSSDGLEANDHCDCPFISADGRYVVFKSSASNLVPGDTNLAYDVFVRDRQTGQTGRVSVASDGAQGNWESNWPSISADGRYVAFYSYASNLVPGDTNWRYDVFVHDRQTRQTSRVSVASDGAQGNDGSNRSCISADGRYVAFESSASNLVAGDTNGHGDVFVRDRQTGEITRISLASDGTQANSYGGWPSISADGRYVAFYSYASNLVPGDASGYYHIFVRDRYAISATKAMPDGGVAVLSGDTVTASLSGAFYAEDADRSSGIKVVWPGAVTEGDRYRVDGTLDTDENGERCIDATNVRRIDSLPLVPLGLGNLALGGRDYQPDTGPGQPGVADASGLNNIGLLIRTWGKVTQKGADYLYIDDGSDVRDGTLTGSEENVGVRVMCDPSGFAPGDFLEVTGISSCFETPSGSIARRILTRRAEDVRKIVPGP